MHRNLLGIAMAALLVLPVGTALGAGEDRAPVPTPTVSEPLTGGVRGYPFNGLPDEPASLGLVETEHLVSGTATAYDLSPTALRAAGASAPVPAPFTTRALVRRPADPKRFNGTVVIEWLNVTSGYDVEASWAELRQELVRGGYAYVGLTAQVVGANVLKAWDPVRYAGVAHPGDPFSYDVLSQVARATRVTDLLGGLAPERVLATGASQSGSALNNYLRLVAPKVERVIDGVLVMTSSAAVPAPEVPVIRVQTEGEAGAGQPDSAYLREWEIASATHVDTYGGDWFARTHERDFAPGWPLTPGDQERPDGTCYIGRLPKNVVMHAAVALDRWVGGGEAAPTAPRITMAADGSVARDDNDNALGGIRTPAADVPTASYYGDKDECAPTMGRTNFFPQEKLDALYPTQQDYVRQVRQAVARSVAAGFLLPVDGRIIVEQARTQPIEAGA